MQRRAFLKHSLSAAGLAVLAPHAIADAVQLANYSQAFHVGMADQPWLLAYRSATRDQFDAKAETSGLWPTELSGTLYRNGPARHEIGEFRYGHWFDGDGMVQAFRIDARGVHHRGRLVETTKLRAERAAGRALYPGFGSLPPNPAPVSSPDLVNVANISVLPHNGKLLALWEAGSPWEIDPNTLETIGKHSYDDDTAGAPFSAHPRVEPDGTVWNFGYVSNAGLMVFWHIAPNGKLVQAKALPVDPMTMPHDFVVTENHLVVLLPPLHFRKQSPSQAGSTFLDAHEWVPTDPTRVLVVDKSDLTSHRWLELPAQWVFHFGNAWEADGVIHFDAARADSPQIMFDAFRAVMRGESFDAVHSTHHRYRLDLKRGQASEVPMLSDAITSEFPTIDPRVSCRRNRRLVMLTADTRKPAAHPLLNAVSVWEDDTERLRSFTYPDDVLPEEHLYVPKPGSALETAGWVLGSALDVRAQQTVLNLFDVDHVEDGPIASARLPYALPMGLHGKFV